MAIIQGHSSYHPKNMLLILRWHYAHHTGNMVATIQWILWLSCRRMWKLSYGNIRVAYRAYIVCQNTVQCLLLWIPGIAKQLLNKLLHKVRATYQSNCLNRIYKVNSAQTLYHTFWRWLYVHLSGLVQVLANSLLLFPNSDSASRSHNDVRCQQCLNWGPAMLEMSASNARKGWHLTTCLSTHVHTVVIRVKTIYVSTITPCSTIYALTAIISVNTLNDWVV